MARFHGAVGFAQQVEDPPDSGVYVDQIDEIAYFGDVIRNARRLEPGTGLADDITIGNSISIVADERAMYHFHQIKYAVWEGVAWDITSVEVKAPRLVLSLGGVYNGPRP